MRIKCFKIENNENKNIKLLKNIEARNAERKLINGLTVNCNVTSNYNEILNEQKNLMYIYLSKLTTLCLKTFI